MPIYKVGKQGDVLYIVMRCVDGPSLRQLLATQQRLLVGDAARIAPRGPPRPPSSRPKE